MATEIEISQLPPASSVNDADVLPIVQGGVTKKVTKQIFESSFAGSVTQVDTGTGLTGGPITSTGTISLANTTVTPGTYTNISGTVDATGRLTSAGNGSAVTQVNTDSSLTGGPITSTGTLGIANSGVSPGPYNYPQQITVGADGRIINAVSGSPAVTNIQTGTGLTGGPIVSTGTISLANTAVTAGTYNGSYTVDAQGRLTHAMNDTSISPSHIVYVDKNGSDSIGDGTFYKPFLTIQAANNSIFGATASNLYMIKVGEGNFSDAFQLKPYITYYSDSYATCNISGLITLDSAWFTYGATLVTSALIGFTLIGDGASSLVANFTTGVTIVPQLEISNCYVAAPMTIVGTSTVSSSIIIRNNIAADYLELGNVNLISTGNRYGAGLFYASNANSPGGTYTFSSEHDTFLADTFFGTDIETLTGKILSAAIPDDIAFTFSSISGSLVVACDALGPKSYSTSNATVTFTTPAKNIEALFTHTNFTPTSNDVEGYIKGIDTALGAAAGLPALTNTHIWVGNVSNVATDVAMSGDCTIANTGAITIGSQKVSYGKMQSMTPSRLLGNPTGSGAVPSEISLAASLSFAGSTLSVNGGSVTGINATNITTGTLAVVNGGTGVTTSTGTGSTVRSISPALVTPALGVATATSLGFTAGNGVVANTTSTDYSSSYVGYLTSVLVPYASSFPISSNTNADITTLSLGAGHWRIDGNFYADNTGTSITFSLGWLNTTSVTQPDNNAIIYQSHASVAAVSANVPPLFFNSTSPFTVFLTTRVTFGSGTAKACGRIYATLR